jgi:hypothetical protein
MLNGERRTANAERLGFQDRFVVPMRFGRILFVIITGYISGKALRSDKVLAIE